MIKKIKYFVLIGAISTSFLVAEGNKTITTNKPKVEKTTTAKATVTWVNSGSLSPLAKELISQIKKDKTVSYDLSFYKLYKLVLTDIDNNKITAATNKKINKLYYAYMNYLIKGEINWNSFKKSIAYLRKKYDYNVGWETTPPPYSAKSILNNAIASGSFNDIFSKVEPYRYKYKTMKKYLIKFISIRNSGGWGSAGKATLKPGSSSAAVVNIRKHLKLVGDLANCDASADSPVYDNCMAKAVKRFRLRHGLKASSIIDKATRNELSKSVSYYIKKIRLNMDRIKWIRRKEAKLRMELNIPAFRLYIYDGKDLVTTMRVVTGKANHPTPVFSDEMTTVVVNPYWRIPQSIVRKEMLKKLIANPYHYEKQGKYLYKGWGAKSGKIDPSTVDWSKYLGNKKHIPYHFMQQPGNKNALGRIKFLFPNKYAVYIHDTPSKRLFFRTTRAFSHGCMRIQKPRELLKALSLYNKNIHVNALMKKLGTTDNTHIALNKKIPIDITYLTSFVDDYGNLHFRKDVYGYDRLQLKHYGATKSTKIKKKKKKTKKTAKKNKKTTKNKNSNIKEIGY